VIAGDRGHVASVRSGFACGGRVEPALGDQPALLGAVLADVTREPVLVVIAVGDVRGRVIAHKSGRLIARARLRSGSDAVLSIDRSIRGIHVTST
jgi:hypothetical protein